MRRTLLIDGDTLIFEAASANEYETQWDAWLWTLHADFNAAMAHLVTSVNEIRDKLQPDRIIFALSDDARWRPGVMSSYKNHRRKTRKPICYKPLREFAHETMDVFQRPSLEGDDVLGILATHPELVEGEKIIVSIDKDMKTIPGLHLNYSHARGVDDWAAMVISISEAQADRYHLFQTLTGDATDGYPGCPGIGPVTAEKILAESPTWDAVVATYQKAKLGEVAALQNARVARICRHTDYDFTRKEVILWQPPSAKRRPVPISAAPSPKPVSTSPPLPRLGKHVKRPNR